MEKLPHSKGAVTMNDPIIIVSIVFIIIYLLLFINSYLVVPCLLETSPSAIKERLKEVYDPPDELFSIIGLLALYILLFVSLSDEEWIFDYDTN